MMLLTGQLGATVSAAQTVIFNSIALLFMVPLGLRHTPPPLPTPSPPPPPPLLHCTGYSYTALNRPLPRPLPLPPFAPPASLSPRVRVRLWAQVQRACARARAYMHVMRWAQGTRHWPS